MLVLVLLGALLSGQTESLTTRTIVGTVIDTATANPVAGARIRLLGPDVETQQPLYTKTDREGRFEFVNLNPGGYVLWPESPGFSAGDERDWTRLSLTGGPREVVKLSLSPLAVIFGKLTGAGGFPVAGARIDLIDKFPAGSTLPDFGQMTTDDRGEFRTAHLRPGTYYLVARKENLPLQFDPATRDTYYPHARDLGTATPVQVAAGQQVRADIQLVREAAVRVTGRLPGRDAAGGSPGSYSYTNVSLYPDDNVKGNPYGPFTNTKSGRFKITDVLPGKYLLSAATIQQSDPSGNDRKVVLAGAQHIEVKERDLTGLEVELQPLRDLPGTVTFPKGCTPVPLRVSASTANRLGNWESEAMVAAGGKFVLTGFTPSRYDLSIGLADGSWAKAVSAVLGGRDVLKSGFEYPFPEGSNLQIVMDCPMSGPAAQGDRAMSCIRPVLGLVPVREPMDGDVADSVTGAPIAGAYLLNGNVSPAAVSDSKGRFRLPEPAEIEAVRAGYFPARLSYNAQESRMHVVLTPQAAIFGKVTDEDGFPVDGAAVEALTLRTIGGRSELRSAGESVRVNDLGEYRIAALPAGRYYVRVWPSALHDWDWRYVEQYYPGAVVVGDAHAVEVKAGEKRIVDIKVSRYEGATVSGYVLGLEGVGSSAGVLHVHPYLIPEDKSLSIFQTRCLAKDAGFSFAGVPPGKYMIHVTSGGDPVRVGDLVAKQSVEVGKTNVSGIVLKARAVEAADLPYEKPPGR